MRGVNNSLFLKTEKKKPTKKVPLAPRILARSTVTAKPEKKHAACETCLVNGATPFVALGVKALSHVSSQHCVRSGMFHLTLTELTKAAGSS